MSAALVAALLAPLALGSDPVATVPMKEWSNLVLVPISVQGSSPFQIVLDTAMSLPGIILFKGERLDALGLDFQGDARISGGGGDGRAAIRQAKASGIELGGLTLPDVVVSTFPDAPPLPGDLEGIIGFELFQRFAVRVDRAHGVVELHESAKLEPAEGSTQVPLQIKDRFPCVQVMVAIADEAPVAAELIVDLGAVHALWLNTDSEGRFAPPPKAIATSLGYGAGGRVEGRAGRTRLVQIGDVRLENVVTVFPAPAQHGPGDPDIRDGFIGADVLSRFDVTVDYPGQRLVLGPARSDAPFEWDMSGLLLNPSGGIVDSVVEGSAAEQAGILVGDVLVSVDDRPFAEVYGAGLRQTFRRDGAEVRIVIQRGDERLEKRLRLKRLI